GRKMVIVDWTGIHEMIVHFCQCNQSEADDLQLMRMALYPGSTKRPKTVFIFQVLDEYNAHNLECKTNAREYYATLQRTTSRGFPHLVQNQYCELMQVSRQWRHLKSLKWHGYGHPDKVATAPGPGSLSLFCAACPQSGVNLQPGWEEEAQRIPWLYTLNLNLDGNMKVEQFKMKRDDLDVVLTDGSGMMVAEAHYYLPTVPSLIKLLKTHTCNNHRAVSQGSSVKRHLRVTGIGAVACSCHGTFMCCDDFQLGER
ncbi:hypothetical protein JAAARDRAFT_106348, partial [Jaapia argillacea MUCL 33604]